MLRFHPRRLRLAFAAPFLALACVSLRANPPTWAGNSGDDVNNPSKWLNWLGSNAPGASDQVVISSGTATVSTNTEYGSLAFSGGAITGNAALTLGTIGTSTWTGGTLSLSNGNGLFVKSGASLTISSGTHDFSGTFVTNNSGGNVTWSGGALRTGSAGAINNSGSFTDTATDSISNAFGGTQGTFNNAGTYNKNGGSANIGLAFTNSGTVNLNGGTLTLSGGGNNQSGKKINVASGAGLAFAGGDFTIASGADIVDAGGVYTVSSGTVTVSSGTATLPTLNVSGGTLGFTSGGATSSVVSLSGGTIASGTITTGKVNQSGGSLAASAVTVSGSGSTWTAGDMNGAGSLTIQSGADLSISSGTHDFNQHAINNNGSITWGSGALRTGSNGSITNSGTFTDTASDSISNAFGGPQGAFANSGTYNKGGSGTTTIGLTFNNTGTVNVNAGTLALTGGGTNSAGKKINVAANSGLTFGGGAYTIASGADIVDAGGIYTVSSGTVTVSSGTATLPTLNVSGGTLGFTSGGATSSVVSLSGGTIASGTITTGKINQSGGSLAASAVTVSGSGSTWTAGDMNGAGSLTIQSGADLSISSGTHDFNQHAINNNGSITWGSGALRTGSNGSITNSGTFTDTASDSISNAFGGTQGSFSNTGTYNKNGSGTTSIGLTFANSGTVNVNSGVLTLNGGGSNASGKKINVASGAGVTFAGGDFTLASGADIVDAGGTYAFSGGNVTISAGTATLPNVSINGGSLGFVSGGANSNAIALTSGSLRSGSITTGKIMQSGGSASGAAVTVTGTGSNWTGGDMNGTGSLTIQSGADLSISSGTHDFNQHAINNNGSITWSSGALRTGSSGSLSNNGTFTDTASDSMSNAFGGTASTFTNGGTYNKNGAGTTTMGLVFANNGALNVNAGTFVLSGGGSSSAAITTSSTATTQFAGDYTLGHGASLNGSGQYQVSGGTLNVSENVSVGKLSQSGGTLAPAGILTVTNFELNNGTVGGVAGGTLAITGNFSWTHGNMNGTGTTSLGNGVTLTIDDAVNNVRDFNSHAIVNNGTVNWNSSYIRSGNGGSFTNAAGGTFNDNNTSGYTVNNPYGGSYVFTNNGTYNRNATGTTFFDTTFDHNGTLNLQTGDIELRAGGTMGNSAAVNTSANTNFFFRNNYTVQNGAALAGSGTYWLTAGTLTLGGTLSAQHFKQTGGALAGGFSLGGTYDWSGGNWNGTGGPSTAITAGTILNLTDTNDNVRDFSNRSIVNHGTVNWSSGYLRSGNSGSFENAVGGTFNDNNASSYTVNNPFGGTFVFTNNGSYVRDAGGTTFFDTTFNNNGSVHVKNGNLELRSGGTMSGNSTISADSGTNVFFRNNYTVQDGSSLTGAGTYWLTNGTLTVSGAMSASHFKQTSGVLAGINSLIGTFDWSGGNWNGSAGDSTTIVAGNSLNLTDTNDNLRDFSTRAIVNHGTVNWASGYLRSGNGGTFENAAGATFNDSNVSGYTINNPFGGSFVFTNNGTYRRNAGGTTFFDTTFNNNGTIDLQGGNIEFRAGGTLGTAASVSAATGTNVFFRTDYSIQNGSALGGAGTYWLTGGTLTLSGAMSVGHFKQTAGALAGVNSISGAIDWSGGNWNATGTVPTTSLTAGSTLTLTDSNDNLRDFNGRAIVNHGSVNWSSGYLRSGSGGSFTNATDGTFTDTNAPGYTIQNPFGGSFVFTNDGTYNRNATGASYFDATFNNNGHLNLQQGDIQIRSGGAMSAASVVTTSSGTNLYITNNYTLQDGAQFTGTGNVDHTGGTLTINGGLRASSFTWSGGNWNGAGNTTVISGTTLTLTDVHGNLRDFDSRTIVNQGTVNWYSGYLRSGNSGSFTNAAGGAFNDFNAPGYAVQNAFGGAFAFTNNGTYTRNTTGTTYFDTTFNNNGQLNLDQGDIQIRGGGAMGASSVAKAATGTHLYITDNYTLLDGAQFTGNGLFNQIGGTLTLEGSLRASSFLWSGGNWNGAGNSTIASGSTLNLSDANGNLRDFDSRTITNQGIVNWSSGYLRSGHGGSFTNASGATFNDLNSPGYSVQNAYGGTFAFTNNGTYLRNVGGTTYFDTTFNNNGRLDLQQGDIQLRGGGVMGATSVVVGAANTHLYITNDYTLTDGASFTGAGLFDHIGGTLTVNGALTASNFVWSGGNWNATGTVPTTRVANGSLLTLTDGHDNTRDFRGRAVVNDGVVNWNSGYLRSGDGGSFTNASDGIFNDLNSPGYSVQNPFGGTFTFTNNGTYNKSTGGTTTFSVPFANNGTLLLGSGQMVFNGTFTNQGNIVFSNGASAQFSNALTFAHSTLSGTGTLNAPAVTAGALVSPGNSPGVLTITGDFTLLNTSILLIELGGRTQGSNYDFLNVGGAAALNGTLAIQFTGGFQSGITTADTFTVLTANGTGGLTGSFLNVANGQRVSTFDGLGSFQVNFGGGFNSVTLSNFQPVPEPSTYALMGAGLAALGWATRRKRR